MAEVTLTGVTKTFPGGTVAVDNVDLEIADGELLVLVGPSGSGKTTVLRLTAGLEELTDGEIRIGDRVVNDLHPMDRDIAMVFQNYALYPHMTVRENIGFGLRLRHRPKAEIRERVDGAARKLALFELLSRKPGQLSGGQRQRVAMGRAIVRDPAAFLMDEPLSNLDAKLRVEMRAYLATLHHRLRTTTLYVTHDQTEAMTLGDRVTVLKKGIVQQCASPRELYDQPANRFVAGFIGSPSMNFIEGTVDGTGDAATLKGPGDFSIPVPARYRQSMDTSGRKVAIGFRPEHLELSDITEPSGSFTGRADVVEYLGNEELLHVTAAEQDIVGIVGSEHHVKPGDVLKLNLPLSKLHLFDAESGATLVPERVTAAA